ncbi:hypothetical protein G6O69_25440 [Pseudenhygromyxa sp. WMMC2535]|nr:hypothetical protein [Pseudenhygromyxa sp. WMMC2535]
MSSTGEQLYVVEGPSLWSLALDQRAGPARAEPRAMRGACEAHVDLEIWNGKLFALCREGGLFVIPEPEPGATPEAWREWSPTPPASSRYSAATPCSSG